MAVVLDRTGNKKKFHDIDWNSATDVEMFIQEAVENGSSSFEYHHAKWHRNAMFYYGRQYTKYSRKHRDMVYVQTEEDWQAQSVTNLIKPTVRNFVARMTKNDPRIEVNAVTADDNDIAVADLATNVLRGYADKLGIKGMRTEFDYYLHIYGNAFWRVAWDAQAGGKKEIRPEDLMAVEPQDEMQMQIFLAEATEKFKALTGTTSPVKVPMGDLKIEVLNPFRVFWDLNYRFEESAWKIVTGLKPLAWAKANWPEFADEMKPSADFRPLNSSYEQFSMEDEGTPTAADSVSDNITVHELYLQPTPEFPKGRYACCAGGVLVVNGDDPLEGDSVFMCGEVFIPGRNVFGATIDDLIDLQIDYNDNKNKIIDNRTLMANMKWMVHKTAGLLNKNLNRRPGEIVEWGGEHEPKIVSPPNMPSYLFDYQGTISRDWQDVSGQHEISQARAPGAATAGYALEKLLEIDDTRLGPTIRNYEECESKMWRKALEILRMFVTEPRMIRIGGKDAGYASEVLYDGDRLAGQKEGHPGISYHDVTVDLASGMSNSKTEQREAFFEALNKGGYNPAADPTDKKIVRQELSKYGINAPDMVDIKQAEAQASYENRELKEGKPVPVMYYHNHEIHLQYVNRARNAPDFHLLAPEIQQIFHQHAQEHEMFMQPPQPMAQGGMPPDPNLQGGQPAMEPVMPPQ